MKYSLFLFFILHLGLTYAQNNLIVATTDMNKLFLERTNPIEVSVDGKFCKDLILNVDNGKIAQVKGTDCSYQVKPIHIGKAIITAYDKKSGKLLDSFTLQVQNLPNPIITLGAKNMDGSIEVEKLIEQRGPIAYYECGEMGYYPIVKYRITILREGNNLFSKLYTEPEFDADLKKVFSSLQKGDVLVFTDVHCKDIRDKMHIIKLAAAEVTVR